MFKHFIIFQSSGVPLFSFSNRDHGNHDKIPDKLNTSVIEKSTLFSGLLSSIISLGKELGGTLQQIKLNNADLYAYEHENIIGASLTDPETGSGEIEKYKNITKFITKQFVKKYEDKITKWNGNTTIFDDFTREFDKFELLQKSIDPTPACTPCLILSCDMTTTK